MLIKNIKSIIRSWFFYDLMADLANISDVFDYQKSLIFMNWVSEYVPAFVDEYFKKNALNNSGYVRSMNSAFNTTYFGTLVKKWLAEYLILFLATIDCPAFNETGLGGVLKIENNTLNRFAVKKYTDCFNKSPRIKWKKPRSAGARIAAVVFYGAHVLIRSLNRGVRLDPKRKKFKVLREIKWGLKGINGYYFHDDFLVDDDIIKKEDLLLFSRGVPDSERGALAYQEALKSSYEFVNILKLPISLHNSIRRIIPKYLFSPVFLLLKSMRADNYFLFSSISFSFASCGIIYEKLFSNYSIISQLGQNYYSHSHIAEAIICRNHGAKYYLPQWSDNSMLANKLIMPFLGCDKLFVWGKAHVYGVEGANSMILRTGYVFKKFIEQVKNDRDKVLSDMKIIKKGKILAFFDESFGGASNITEKNYHDFWKVIVEVAKRNMDNTIIIKEKDFQAHKLISDKQLRNGAEESRNILDKMENVFIVDPIRWSFIEVIGIADLVVTQGMSSSSTIAIICGKEGLYFEPATLDHPFAKMFKDTIAFDDAEKLVKMIDKIVMGEESPKSLISESVMRDYDEYPDDRGIVIYRKILAGRVDI